MASKTKETRTRRANKRVAVGMKRKNALRLHGSTAPNLPLTAPNANERAQQKSSAAAR